MTVPENASCDFYRKEVALPEPPGSGFYVGTTRYIKPWAVRVKRIPGRVWNPTESQWEFWYESKAMVGNEANAAHIVYEVLTNADWGMGYPTSAIHDVRFRAAADTLYAEGIGLGFVWTKQDSIEGFIQEILNHINAVLRLDPVTGQFWLKLIRDDYDPSALPLLDESNVIELQSFQRVGWGETVNEIVLKYRGINGKEKSITVHNLANWQIQGRIVSETVDYPGCRSDALALRLARRDLKVKSVGLAALRLKVNRTAHELGPGDVFRFSWAALGLTSVVMRVGTVSGGTLTDGAITIEAGEDVFGLGDTVVTEEDEEAWVQPDPVPDPSTLPAPAAPTGLAAAGIFQLIVWTWTVADSSAKSELWVSQTNDRTTATRLYQDYGAQFEQQATGGSTWYGWVRAIDTYGNYSDWAPTSATGGVSGVAANTLDASRVPGAATSTDIESAIDAVVPRAYGGTAQAVGMSTVDTSTTLYTINTEDIAGSNFTSNPPGVWMVVSPAIPLGGGLYLYQIERQPDP